jgi:hypothetical protein
VKVRARLNHAEGAFLDIRLKPSETGLGGCQAGPKGWALVGVVEAMGEVTKNLSGSLVWLNAVLG